MEASPSLSSSLLSLLSLLFLPDYYIASAPSPSRVLDGSASRCHWAANNDKFIREAHPREITHHICHAIVVAEM